LGVARTHESADLQKQILMLRRKEQSYFRQLIFWTDTVANLGTEHDRAPSKLEQAVRKKLIASGDWPTHMTGVQAANFGELGRRFADFYRGGLHSLSSD